MSLAVIVGCINYPPYPNKIYTKAVNEFLHQNP